MRLLDRLLGREKRQDAARDADGGGMPLAEPGVWVFGDGSGEALPSLPESAYPPWARPLP